MRRLFSILACSLLLNSACVPPKPPTTTPPPATHGETVTVWTPQQVGIAGAQVTLQVANYLTDSLGRVVVTVPNTVCVCDTEIFQVSATGYQTARFTRSVCPTACEQPAFVLEPNIPDPPSRDDAINIHTPFNGNYYLSAHYSDAYRQLYGGDGHIPFFGDAFCDFAQVGDGDQVLDQIQADPDGPFTHVLVAWHHGGNGYDEANQPYGLHQLIPPANMSADDYRACADLVIKRGLKAVYVVNGEDGAQAVLDTFQSQHDALQVGYDRTPYGPFLVSYDGVWPAQWTVTQMQTVIPWMHTVIGDQGYLGFMYANGPAGNPYLWVLNSGDYTQPWADGLDIVVTTSGPPEAECVSMANKAQYMADAPDYGSAGCQPSFSGHFSLVPNTRGNRAWGDIEWQTYGTVRDPNQTLHATIAAQRRTMQRMNVRIWG